MSSIIHMSLYICKRPPSEPLRFWCEGICEHRPRICSKCLQHNGLGKNLRRRQLTGPQQLEFRSPETCNRPCHPTAQPLPGDARYCFYPRTPKILVPEQDLPDECPLSGEE